MPRQPPVPAPRPSKISPKPADEKAADLEIYENPEDLKSENFSATTSLPAPQVSMLQMTFLRNNFHVIS